MKHCEAGLLYCLILTSFIWGTSALAHVCDAELERATRPGGFLYKEIGNETSYYLPILKDIRDTAASESSKKLASKALDHFADTVNPSCDEAISAANQISKEEWRAAYQEIRSKNLFESRVSPEVHDNCYDKIFEAVKEKYDKKRLKKTSMYIAILKNQPEDKKAAIALKLLNTANVNQCKAALILAYSASQKAPPPFKNPIPARFRTLAAEPCEGKTGLENISVQVNEDQAGPQKILEETPTTSPTVPPRPKGPIPRKPRKLDQPKNAPKD